jgi:hypothetical protein
LCRASRYQPTLLPKYGEPDGAPTNCQLPTDNCQLTTDN